MLALFVLRVLVKIGIELSSIVIGGLHYHNHFWCRHSGRAASADLGLAQGNVGRRHQTVTDTSVTIAVDGDEPEENPVRTGHVRTNGKNIWEDQKTRVPNQELKSMVEAYKTRAPQARDQKATEPRESAREKLDALVKDTASKVSPEKTPKAKSKAKTGPEL